jgi:L-alanine-DL-glutamate epimerase-like enolase superfamily enzyme
MTKLTVVTFELETDTGVTGFGYTMTYGRGGHPLHATLLHELGPITEGREISSPAVTWDEVHAAARQLGRAGIGTSALSAVDAAIWDAASKSAGLPLYRYLGAVRESIPAYGSSFDQNYADEDLVASTVDYVKAGMTTVKLKVGRGHRRDDERRLGAVRDAIGHDVRIGVDVNGMWNFGQTLQNLSLLEEFDIDFLEEPMRTDDPKDYRELQTHTRIPIAGGETLASVQETYRYLSGGAFQLLQLDVHNLGGITPWLRAAALGAATGIPVASHLTQEVCVHLLCATPPATLLEYMPVCNPFMIRPLAIGADGTVRPSDVAGHGVEFNRDLIEGYKIA